MSGVVVGLDDSEQARAALEWATRYVAREDLQLTVITVVDPLVATALWGDDGALTLTSSSFLATARDEAQERVREVVDGAGLIELDIAVRAVLGHPVKELVDASAKADLLVVGSRGVGRFARLLLGSTACGVAQHAHCSVMIVRTAVRRAI